MGSLLRGQEHVLAAPLQAHPQYTLDMYVTHSLRPFQLQVMISFQREISKHFRNYIGRPVER